MVKIYTDFGHFFDLPGKPTPPDPTGEDFAQDAKADAEHTSRTAPPRARQHLPNRTIPNPLKAIPTTTSTEKDNGASSAPSILLTLIHTI